MKCETPVDIWTVERCGGCLVVRSGMGGGGEKGVGGKEEGEGVK